MEVRFTPEQEARIADMATKTGNNPERLVQDVVVQYLDSGSRFLAAIEKGYSSAFALSRRGRCLRGQVRRHRGAAHLPRVAGVAMSAQTFVEHIDIAPLSSIDRRPVI